MNKIVAQNRATTRVAIFGTVYYCRFKTNIISENSAVCTILILVAKRRASSS